MPTKLTPKITSDITSEIISELTSENHIGNYCPPARKIYILFFVLLCNDKLNRDAKAFPLVKFKIY